MVRLNLISLFQLKHKIVDFEPPPPLFFLSTKVQDFIYCVLVKIVSSIVYLSRHVLRVHTPKG